MRDPDCIFCRIAAGELPADKVYEDERVVAFRDINPQAPVHVLVVPREHYPTLLDAPLDEGLMDAVFRAVRAVAEKEGLTEKGFRTAVNCREWGGQVVWHLHFHVLGGRRMSGKLG